MKAKAKTLKKAPPQKSQKAPTRAKVAAKATAKRKAKASEPKEAHSLFMSAPQDPAHSPGHRKMNIKDNFASTTGSKTQTQGSAAKHLARADKIKQTSATNRRIITGAAIGKTGQITIK